MKYRKDPAYIVLIATCTQDCVDFVTSRFTTSTHFTIVMLWRVVFQVQFPQVYPLTVMESGFL